MLVKIIAGINRFVDILCCNAPHAEFRRRIFRSPGRGGSRFRCRRRRLACRVIPGFIAAARGERQSGGAAE